uniref:Trypsin n=1 Tax=Antheraea pernyi TaxID=7119 RepID=W5X3N9_ANTPE|nr:trypsin [Antheraea pernyi]
MIKMHNIIVLLALCLSTVAAVPANPQRIVGGSITTIGAYPNIVALLFSRTNAFRQDCGGTILNNRSVLTAAHCVFGDLAAQWRARVGSTSSVSGGVLHFINRFIIHPSYNRNTLDNDVAIMRTQLTISFNNNVRAASFAPANYNLADNQVVWAAGWGATVAGGAHSTSLRHVQIWTINQTTCRNRYLGINTITANMLCSGWLDVGGRDQCTGDSGGPLYHRGILVGVRSFGRGCGQARFPGVNARVSRFAAWIRDNI